MSTLDVVLIVLLLPFALRGWWRGFLREACSLAGLVLGAFAAATWSNEVARELIARDLLAPVPALVAALAGLFLAVYVVAVLIGWMADRVARVLLLGPVNSTAGVVFGVAKGATLIGFALLLLPRALPDAGLAKAISASRIAPALVRLSSYVIDAGGDLAAANRTEV